MLLASIYKELKHKGIVFIEDDVEEVVVRLSLKGDKLSVYAKRHGGKERETRTDIEVVHNALVQGKEIAKKRYDEY